MLVSWLLENGWILCSFHPSIFWSPIQVRVGLAWMGDEGVSLDRLPVHRTHVKTLILYKRLSHQWAYRCFRGAGQNMAQRWGSEQSPHTEGRRDSNPQDVLEKWASLDHLENLKSYVIWHRVGLEQLIAKVLCDIAAKAKPLWGHPDVTSADLSGRTEQHRPLRGPLRSAMDLQICPKCSRTPPTYSYDAKPRDAVIKPFNIDTDHLQICHKFIF